MPSIPIKACTGSTLAHTCHSHLHPRIPAFSDLRRKRSLRNPFHLTRNSASSAASFGSSNQDDESRPSKPNKSNQQQTTPTSSQRELGLPSVPWGISRVFQVMGLWVTAFYTVGTLAVPMCLEALSISQADLGARGQAVLYLLIDFVQLLCSFFILRWCAHQHGNRRLRAVMPFNTRKWRQWLPIALLSCLVFPLIDLVAHQSTSFFPADADAWAVNVEHSVYVGDWGANLAYMITTLLCAPVWEEAIFRGFLLTSLGNLMPTFSAMCLSSWLFALFHFKLNGFLPLFLLGLLFSYNYLKSGSLASPIFLHSMWNLYLWITMALRSGGV